MNIILGIIIIALIVYFSIQNDLKMRYEEARKLVRAEEEKQALDRIESLIVDLRDDLLKEMRFNHDHLLERHEKTFKTLQRIEVLVFENFDDDEIK